MIKQGLPGPVLDGTDAFHSVPGENFGIFLKIFEKFENF